MTGAPTIDELVVADPPEAWESVGFRVEDGVCAVSTVNLVLAGPDAGRGLVSWSVRGLPEGADLDGLPTATSTAPERQPATPHPNSVIALDHLVVFTPDRKRTAGAIEATGLEVRRMRDEPSPGGAGFQAFFRLGEVVLEVIEYAPGTPHAGERDASARLWGLSFTVESMERCQEALGDRLGSPGDAVQPGRRIATVRRSAGLGVPVAFMTPGPKAA